MKKTITIISMFVLFVSACALASAYNSNELLRFGQIRSGSVYDNNLELHYNARNDYNYDIENVKAILWIPEIGFYTRTTTFDLDDGEKHGQFLFLPLDEVPSGEYLARLTLSSDYHRDVKWIWLDVE